MGGCVQGCFLHCLKNSCNVCICDCCFNPYKKSYMCRHETSNGKSVFNDAFALILYDKWMKEQNEVYQQREELFQEFWEVGIQDKSIVRDLKILDMGCGTGIWADQISKTFMTHNDDTLICLDVSPQCLHWVRTRVAESMFSGLKDKHVEYFCNDADKLCIDTNYDDDDIDVILMAYTLRQISAKTGDRYSIMKELHTVCKPHGILIIIEYGPDSLKALTADASATKEAGATEDNKKLLGDSEEDEVAQDEFTSFESMQQYVESFGYRCDKRIMTDSFKERQWIGVFRKKE